MRVRYYIPLLALLFFSVTSCTVVPEEPIGNDQVEEREGEQPGDENNGEVPGDGTGEEQPGDDDQSEEPQQDASLQLVALSEDMAGIDLTNTFPVRGVQFTIQGVALADVLTTSRSEDFLASFNQENGRVLIVSLDGDEIPPGEGLIAEILFDGDGPARLSEIVIAE